MDLLSKNIQTYRRLVSDAPQKGVLVELGSREGLLVCSIADLIINKELEVFCVDTFKEVIPETQEEIDVYRKFDENIKKAGLFEKITPLVMKTNDAIDFMDEIDLLFIDKDYSFKAMINDIENWMPKVKEGGVIVGRSFVQDGVIDGAMRAAQELLGEVAVDNNIWIKQL